MPAHAQGSLPIGQISNITASNVCTGAGWFSAPGATTICENAIVSCPNTVNTGVNFAYTSPSGIPNGVITFFNGGDGTAPAGDATGTPAAPLTMAQTYFAAGYEIVQVAWTAAWEGTDQGQSGQLFPGNIQTAACRPATFINWVYNNVYLPITQQGSGGNPKAGMCAQGSSAGSAQIAYSLAYYGAYAWFDNVELISGPVLSDIDQGCEINSSGQGAPSVTICPAGQWGCPQPNQGGASWMLSPTYLGGYATAVQNWTYDLTCASKSGTTQQSDLRWLNMSIVDQPPVSGGPTPTFTYPNTAMSAWLCRGLQNQQSTQICATEYGEYQDDCPNNSSPQGEIFYNQITSTNSPPHYNIYPVDLCSGPEGVSTPLSNVPGFYYSAFGGIINGTNAITDDMIGYNSTSPPISIPAQCFHGQHTQGQ
jgi:hypothetical protein